MDTHYRYYTCPKCKERFLVPETLYLSRIDGATGTILEDTFEVAEIRHKCEADIDNMPEGWLKWLDIAALKKGKLIKTTTKTA